MTKIPAELVFNHGAIVTIHIIKLLGINVTKTSVREAIFSSQTYPYVTLDYLSKLYEKWGVSSLPVQFSSSILDRANPPIILLSGPRKDELRSLSIITGVTKNNIYRFDPSDGMIKASRNEFEEKMSNSILLLTEKTHSLGEQDYHLKKQTEQIYQSDFEKKTIRVIDNFLTPDECKSIIKSLDIEFTTSKIEGNKFSSSSIVIDEVNLDVDIKDKIKSLPSLATLECKYLEIFKIRRKEKIDFKGDKIKDMSHTLIIYFNHDFENGETYFNELDLKIEPRTGKAILINNLDEEGNKNLYSMNEELLVGYGTKYIGHLYFNAF